MKSLSIYLLPLIGLIFYSCIDDPVNPDGNMIRGTIYDKYGGKQDAGFLDFFYISPGNEPITVLDNGSDFSINSLSLPYDFVITSYSSKYVVKYQDININNIAPIYQDPFNNEFLHWDYRRIKVKFPMVRKKTLLFLKFLSDSLYFQIRNSFIVNEGDSLAYMEILIPSENYFIINITGNVLFLEAEDMSSYPQITFNKFGVKSLDSINNEDILEFKESDLSYNPSEVKSSFTNIPPGGRDGERSRVSLTFRGKKVYSDLLLYDQLPDNCTVNIPLLPGIEYDVKYTGEYRGSNFDHGTKDIIVSPGENAVVTHKEPPALVFPVNGDSNIIANSEFKISDDNTPGVFMYEFSGRISNSAPRNITLFSNSRILKFSDICARGFEWTPATQYTWRVSKIPGFVNVDALIVIVYTNDTRFNGIEVSEFRTFFTRP